MNFSSIRNAIIFSAIMCCRCELHLHEIVTSSFLDRLAVKNHSIFESRCSLVVYNTQLRLYCPRGSFEKEEHHF